MLKLGFKNLRHEEGIKGFPFSLKPLAISLFLSLFLLLFNANPVLAGNVTFAWNAPTERVNGTPVTSSEIKGYNIHYGTASGNYTQTQPITGNVTTYTFTNLPNGVNYYFAVSAIDNADIESGYSSEACKTIGTTTTTCVTTTISNGGGNNNNLTTGGDTEISGAGCGFVKNDGKGQKAKGEGLSLIIMLIITLTGIALARRTGNINATKEGVLVMETRKNSLIKFAAISFLLTIFWSASAYAQPNITSFSGSLTDKGTLVITGTGFGTKARSTPLMWDTVDNQPSYNNLVDGDIIPTDSGKVWSDNYDGRWGNGGPVRYSTSRPQRGVKTAHYYGLGQSYVGWPYGVSDPNFFYVSWYYKPDRDPRSNNGSNKFIRIWDDPNGTGTRISWTQMHLTADYITDWADWGGTINTWNRQEIWVDSVKGIIKTWINGTLTHNVTGFVKANNSYPLTICLIGFDPNIGDLRDTMQSDFGEIYVDNTLSRVEIGNAPTWAASTHREIQIPSVWSGTSITITVNRGSFANFNNAYLYVIDGNGDVNTNGLPLCSTCLKPPTWQ